MFTNRFGVLSAARLADDVRGHEVNSRTDLEPWVFGAVPGPPEVPPKAVALGWFLRSALVAVGDE
jgi:hypothetical protein